MTPTQMLIQNVARAIRAFARSEDMTLPLEQRHFHKGRFEAYIQTVASLADDTVSNVRAAISSPTELTSHVPTARVRSSDY